MFKYIGKKVELKYETGFHFRMEYIDENTLSWTSLKEGEDASGIEKYYLHEQGNDIYTLSWIEDTGFSVTQNLDFNKMEVYAFMSWNDESKRGGRDILDHNGTIKFVD